jgi:hypothetical protein
LATKRVPRKVTVSFNGKKKVSFKDIERTARKVKVTFQ